jgi:hypothetical protein
MYGDVPEQVRQFAPKKYPPPAPEKEPPHCNGDDPLDQTGQAIVVLLENATISSRQAIDRANALAGELSLQLHVAEERINQLQAEIEQVRSRAARAEEWLLRIYQEIEEKLLSRKRGSQQASR